MDNTRAKRHNNSKTKRNFDAVAPLRTSRMRLLPAVIFVAVLMLSVRLGSLWDDYTRVFDGIGVGTTRAQGDGGGREDGGRLAPSATRLQAPLRGAKGRGGHAQSAGFDEQQVARVDPASAASAEAAIPRGANASLKAENNDSSMQDPITFTQSEIDLLQKLAERREILETRNQELDQREALLKAAEGRIDGKISELQQLQVTINGLLKKHDTQEQEKIAKLVKIYATMKPKDAARIFNDLDIPILMSVLENMKEIKSAPILAAMDADKARHVTEELSHRRTLPLPAGR